MDMDPVPEFKRPADALKTCILVVARDACPVDFNGTLKCLNANDGLQAKSIEFVDENTLAVTLTGGATVKVRTRDVRILTGRIPDFALEMSFVEYGYQADVSVYGQFVETHCRDFGGNHDIEVLVNRGVSFVEPWLDAFRKGL